MRSFRPSWKEGSFRRASMCSVIAARITSDTGMSATVATVSRASACSAESRIVMAFAGFMVPPWNRGASLVKRRGVVVSRYQDMEISMNHPPDGPETEREKREAFEEKQEHQLEDFEARERRELEAFEAREREELEAFERREGRPFTIK